MTVSANLTDSEDLVARSLMPTTMVFAAMFPLLSFFLACRLDSLPPMYASSASTGPTNI